MSARTRKSKAPPVRAITLTAHLQRDGELPGYWSQAEAAEITGVTDRTLRDWAKRGLPVHDDDHGRPRYRTDELGVWQQAYECMTRMAERKEGRRTSSGHGWAPRYLSMDDARAWSLAQQFEEWPEDFVLVPKQWDHPAREAQLRLAAAGEKPSSEDWS